jgi:hypothetical protein
MLVVEYVVEYQEYNINMDTIIVNDPIQFQIQLNNLVSDPQKQLKS